MHLLPFSRHSVGALLAFIALTFTYPLHAAEASAQHTPLPLSVFYNDAMIEDIELSPDGTHLLALKNVGEDTVVMVLEIATGKTFFPTKTDNKQFKFNWVTWANNDRLLMSLRFE